jgi:peptidoglycan/LPS O-acetylase OafA/YrhL
MRAVSATRIPSLDGLRALSIGLVLVGHLDWTRNFPLGSPAVADLAELGVRVFFVISGYLITTLLLGDRRRMAAGTLTRGRALGQFYVRRVYRIFPAAYFFLTVVAILSATGLVHLLPGDLACAATYTTNFHEPRAWTLGHLWSLSVEEQFYVLWPAVVLFAGERWALRVALAALAVAPAARVLLWFAGPAYRPYVGEAFPTIFDAIAAGCVLAMTRARLLASARYVRLTSSPAFALVPLAVLALSQLAGRPSIDLVVGQALQNLGIALIVERCIRLPDGASGRLLNWRPLVWLGGLSYSLYLWQQLFINRHSDAWPNAFPVNLALALAAALGSYYLVEQPFLRLRSRRAAAPAAVSSGRR